MWQVMPVFADLEELNQWLEDRCIALWTETAHKALPGSIADVWEAARFPACKDLTGFDFTSSEINEATVRQLHRCEFIEAAENVVLIGGPIPQESVRTSV